MKYFFCTKCSAYWQLHILHNLRSQLFIDFKSSSSMSLFSLFMATVLNLSVVRGKRFSAIVYKATASVSRRELGSNSPIIVLLRSLLMCDFNPEVKRFCLSTTSRFIIGLVSLITCVLLATSRTIGILKMLSFFVMSINYLIVSGVEAYNSWLFVNFPASLLPFVHALN